MTSPEVGDSVRYVDVIRRPCAAIVTNVDGPFRVRLVVFPPDGQMTWVWCLRYDPGLHDDTYFRSKPTVGYWEPRS